MVECKKWRLCLHRDESRGTIVWVKEGLHWGFFTMSWYNVSITAMDVAKHLARLAASEGCALDPMKLQKMLYYIQCWHLAEKGDPLFPEVFKAWKWGPVVPTVWHDYNGNEENPTPDRELNDSQCELVESVWAAMKDFDGLELSKMTHRPNTAWSKARGSLPETAPSSSALDLDHMRQDAENILSDCQRWIADNQESLKRYCA